MKTILSFDPGVHNCGYAVIRYKGAKKLGLSYHNPSNMEILEAGMFYNTVQSMVHPYFNSDIEGFIEEATRLLDLYNPDIVIMERYQTRGFKGTTIEAVNIMIGLMGHMIKSRDKSLYLTIAGQWKNQFAKSTSKNKLKEIYANIHKAYRCPPHVIDAIFINMYGNSRKQGYKHIPMNKINSYLKNIDWKALVKSIDSEYKERTKGRK